MTGTATDLLGGAARRATRVRGFAPWRPQRETLDLLEQVRTVLDEYQDYLPLTLRQVFYRLVGAHGYQKTEASYERLCEHLNRARRSEMIPMHAIRDDGGVRYVGRGWSNASDFLASLHRQAEGFRLDRTEGQHTRLMVLCEAAGMAPQLARITGPYDVPVISSGGFESVTEQYRLAVIPEQITALNLPTAPAKKTDNRAFRGDTCQVESIAPDVLAAILRDAIESRLNRSAYDRALHREAEERDRLIRLIAAGLPGEDSL